MAFVGVSKPPYVIRSFGQLHRTVEYVQGLAHSTGIPQNLAYTFERPNNSTSVLQFLKQAQNLVVLAVSFWIIARNPVTLCNSRLQIREQLRIMTHSGDLSRSRQDPNGLVEI